MAKINITQLVSNASRGMDLADRVHQIAQDPAVQKSWKLAAEDTVRAGKSIGLAVAETVESWYRTVPRYGVGFTA